MTELPLPNDASLANELLTNSFTTSGPTEYVTVSYSSSVILFLSVAAETCVSEPLASNGLLRLSGVMSQYVYISLVAFEVCSNTCPRVKGSVTFVRF
jgi:hypothetical protein